MNELEITKLLNERFYPYLTAKIIWHLRDIHQKTFQAVHHEINTSLIYLNSTRYPGYVVFFYAPNRRNYSGEGPWMYLPDISDSDSDY